MKQAILRLALVCAVASSGCIEAVTTIKVRPDGSGTIEQAMSMNAATAAQFAEMARGLSEATKESGGTASEPELFSEKEMKEAATKYGEGVAFVSSRPIKTADRVGRVAIYEFADISRVKISQKPDAGQAMPGVADDDDGEDVQFRFARQPAGTSRVTVLFPEPKFDEAKAEAAAEAQDKAPDPAQLAMMKTLFDGLRVDIGLEVLGAIVETNSAYVDGPRVTLLQMDFSQLLENEQLLGRVAQPRSLEEAKRLLKDVKGFKVNLDREVHVEFK